MSLADFSWLVSPVIAVVAVGVSILIYFKNRNVKALDYHVVSDQRVLSAAAQSVSGIEVLVGGAQLKDPRLVTVQYRNAGSEPLLAEDFERPLTLRDEVPVYSVTVDETPIRVRVSVGGPGSTQGNSIVPIVMNRGEMLTVSYLVDSSIPNITPDYRIIGATRPARDLLAQFQKRRRIGRIAGPGAIAIPIAGMCLAINGIGGTWLGVGVFVLGFLGVFALGAFSDPDGPRGYFGARRGSG